MMIRWLLLPAFHGWSAVDAVVVDEGDLAGRAGREMSA